MASKTQDTKSAHVAFLLLHNVMGLLTKLEESVYASKAGISYQQFLILITVAAAEPPVSQTTISKKIQRNLNSISMIVDRMEKQGLVRRVRSEEDRRETHVSLTDLGREKMNKAIDIGVPLRERLSKDLTEEEVQQAIRLLGKFRNGILQELGKDPIPLDSERSHRTRVIEILTAPRTKTK